jgi:hypothetical protein
MSRVSKYWTLIEPDGRAIESIEARSWLREKFPDLENHSDSSNDRAIQRQLVEIWKDESLSDTTDWQRADYCLRCLISLWLRAYCGELAYRYSGKGFNKEDLYSLVLEDVLKLDRNSFTGKQPLAWQILDKFDPSKSSSLSSFTKLCMRQYKPLLHFLNEQGCRIGSSTPWALLNNIENITKLKRILCNSGVFIPEKKVLFSGHKQLFAFSSVPEKAEKIWLVMQSKYVDYRKTSPSEMSQADSPLVLTNKRREQIVSSFLTDVRLEQIVDQLEKDQAFSSYFYTRNEIEQDVISYCVRYIFALEVFHRTWCLLRNYRAFSSYFDTRNEIEQDVKSYCVRYIFTLEELHRTWCLLQSYRAIYCADQVDSHAGKPLPEPTEEQLRRMVNYLENKHCFTDYTPKKIKKYLLALAEKAREYTYKKPPRRESIDVPINNTSSGSIDASGDSTTNFSDFFRDPKGKDLYEEVEEKDEERFSRKCDKALQDSLDEAIEQIISQYIPKKQKQRQRSLQAHCLFYCEGKSYKEIALELDASDRTIADDLEAKQQATDIRHKTIELLCERVKELASAYCDQAQLQQLDRKIREAFEKEITSEFDQAIAELFTPHNSSRRSLVNVRICYYVKRLRGELGL